MTIGERIKKVRQEKHLTQQELADKIGVKRNTIANYEIGRNAPIDAVTSLICRTFQVNETWLRTGEGEMFDNTARNNELFQWADRLAHEDDESFPKRFALALSRLDTHGWEVMARLADDIVQNRKEDAKPKDTAPAKEPHALTIDEKVAAYRRELEEEEKGKARSSASPDAEESA